ncbi:hypothetical protein [Haliangium sp.]|uniref:hypothetical protein n=1 Tax=Haliangium sp. TaxID=2663208 RepID=UPI003D0BBEEE
MKYIDECSWWLRLAALTGVGAAAALAPAPGCIDPGTSLCTSGVRCPPEAECTADGDGCRFDQCGNGVVDEGEACDDGNVASLDGCKGDCSSDEVCGNGIVDLHTGEECDEGALNGTSGVCSTACTNFCGNGTLEDNEPCDASAGEVVECTDLGFDWGTLVCTNCQPIYSRCGTIGWWRPEVPAGVGSLFGVWGDVATGLVAVGEDDTGDVIEILRYNDGTWVQDGSFDTSIEGTLFDVWGSGPSDVFAVGDGGKVLYYNGSAWSRLNAGAVTTLRDVWGNDDRSDVFAVGDERTVVRYDRDELSWSIEELPAEVPAEVTFEAVWGGGPVDVYVVGSGGTILHLTAAGWRREGLALPGLSEIRLLDVWGTGDGPVFAVGEDGTVLQDPAGDGSWAFVPVGVQEDLRAIWGTSREQVMAVGDNGTVLLHDGRSWMSMESATDLVILGLWGVNGIGLVAVAQDGLVLTYGGWGRISQAPQTAPQAGEATWARGLDDVYAVVAEAPYLLHFDGAQWRAAADVEPELAALLPDEEGERLYDVWGNDRGELVLVGTGGLLLHRRVPGGWERPSYTDGDEPRALYRVFGGANGNIFAVGEALPQGQGEALAEALIVRYDGEQWATMRSGARASLRAVWASRVDEVAFAVGEQGTILRYDGDLGETWVDMDSGTVRTLHAVWGNSTEEVYVVGERGTALSYNGSIWTLLDPMSDRDVTDLWGSRTGRVFAVGTGGSLYYHNGIDRWSPVRIQTDQRLLSVWGVDTGRDELEALMYTGDGGAFGRILVSNAFAPSY